MLLSALDVHLSKLRFQFINIGSDNVWDYVRDFHVIHISHDCTLLAVNFAVCNALVVGVDGETHFLQGQTE